MNSRGGQKEKFSDKISLIYLNQIEAFHASVRGGGGKKLVNFVLAGKIFKVHFFIVVFVSVVHFQFNTTGIDRLGQG